MLKTSNYLQDLYVGIACLVSWQCKYINYNVGIVFKIFKWCES
jgi:hypothetical protein